MRGFRGPGVVDNVTGIQSSVIVLTKLGCDVREATPHLALLLLNILLFHSSKLSIFTALPPLFFPLATIGLPLCFFLRALDTLHSSYTQTLRLC